jgi:hypothetical protein|tara:strand:- start:1287 stop:2351 length:1065 start_codon:yes stop_codon:yes gene_type:complete
MAEIYTRFDKEFDVIKNQRQTVSSGLWSSGVGTLSTFYTSSVQSGSSGQYYTDSYKSNPQTDSEAEVQLSIAYGHIAGSGSYGITKNFPTKAIYAQYRNLLLSPTDTKFTFAGSNDSNDIFAIAVQRSRLREKMDPGNWELWISGSDVNAGGTDDGSVIKLMDDSGATTNPAVNQGGRVFNVVSGSIKSGTAVTKFTVDEQPGGGYGLFYPDLGIIVLRPDMLRASGSLSRVVASSPWPTSSGVNDMNHLTLYNHISASVGAGYFVARREEILNTTHYFARATNRKFNFSTNPTFFTASDGSLTNPSFFRDPKTYITTVGLYNHNNELLAVAKLSRPLLKSFSREAIIKVRLDF